MILDGKKISIDIKNEIKSIVSKRISERKKIPHLAAIIVGNDGASLTYVGSKVRACDYVGFKSTLIRLDDSISEKLLLDHIHDLSLIHI